MNLQEIILRALYKSLEYFEEWNRIRMQNYIGVLIADEYWASQDIQKSSALYTRVLTLYEKESWTPLIKHIKDRMVNFEESKNISLG